MLATDRAVVEDTARAIEQLHRLGIAYAYLFSPLHEDGLATALRRLTILARGEHIGRVDLEVVTPPVFGRHVMVYSTDVSPPQRAFAQRHGMGHVAAGHVTEVSYLTSRNDFMRHEERVADLFALADLVPGWKLEELAQLRRGRPRWTLVHGDVCKELHRLTVDWPEQRLLDRSLLRIALYRDRGI